MSKFSNIRISLLTTPEEKEKAFEVRVAVFVNEQKYPLDTELDGLDDDAVHWAAIADKKNDDGSVEKGVFIGTIRLLHRDTVAKLGRLAVLSEARGLYAGQLLVKEFLNYARENGYQSAVLHSQYPRRGFYQKLGFTVEEGEEIFDEDGTPHIRMWKRHL
ncbi:acyl-CoA N-acyltransferase [Sporodiniella umbellata]|nr:acyl-CoA N-acyltransferase [Sporodiniella umbellata]